MLTHDFRMLLKKIPVSSAVYALIYICSVDCSPLKSIDKHILQKICNNIVNTFRQGNHTSWFLKILLESFL